MIRFQWRTRYRAGAPAKPPDNPYVAARSNFESLFRNQAKEKHAWRTASLAELAIIGVLVVAYVQLASGGSLSASAPSASCRAAGVRSADSRLGDQQR